MHIHLKLLILLMLAGLSARSQAPAPSGLPAPYSTGYYRIGWMQNDSGYIPAYRDTFFIPKFQGTEILWLHAGVDTATWIRIGNKWVKEIKANDIIPISAANGLNYTSGNVQLGGTLTKLDTIATTANYSLLIYGAVPVSTSNALLNLSNTGNFGAGIYSTATNGSGVNGVSTSGSGGNFSSSSGAGISALSSSGNAISANKLVSTASNVDVIEGFSRSVIIATPAIGQGLESDWTLPNSTVGGNLNTSRFKVIASSVTSGSFASDYHISLPFNGTYPSTDQFIVKGAGGVQFGGYGSGTHLGLKVHGLAEDASGNIIEDTTSSAVEGPDSLFGRLDNIALSNLSFNANTHSFDLFGVSVMDLGASSATSNGLIDINDNNDSTITLTEQATGTGNFSHFSVSPNVFIMRNNADNNADSAGYVWTNIGGTTTPGAGAWRKLPTDSFPLNNFLTANGGIGQFGGPAVLTNTILGLHNSDSLTVDSAYKGFFVNGREYIKGLLNSDSIKITKPIFANGTATLMGIGSADSLFGKVVLGTNLSMAHDTLNATGGGGGSTLTLGTGLTGGSYNGSSPVTSLVDTSIIYNRKMSDSISSRVDIGSTSQYLRVLGDSYMTGQGVATTDSNMAHLVAGFTGKILDSSMAVGGTGGVQAVINSNKSLISYGNEDVLWGHFGFNDLRRGGNGYLTFRKLANNVRTVFINHYLASAIPASGAVRTGTWNTIDLSSLGSKTGNSIMAGATSMYSTTSGNTISYTTPVATNNIVWGEYVSDSIHVTDGTYTVTIDGLSYGTFSQNAQCDGLSDGFQNNQQMPNSQVIWLQNTRIHTITLTTSSTHNTFIDFFGYLRGFSRVPAIFIDKIPKMLASQYAFGGGQTPPANNGSAVIFNEGDSIITANAAPFLARNYPIGIVNVNSFFTPDVAHLSPADSVHPNAAGYAQLASAVYDRMNFKSRTGLFPDINGTIYDIFKPNRGLRMGQIDSIQTVGVTDVFGAGILKNLDVPYMFLNAPNATTGQRMHDWYIDNSGIYHWRILNNIASTSQPVVDVYRTLNNVDSFNIGSTLNVSGNLKTIGADINDALLQSDSKPVAIGRVASLRYPDVQFYDLDAAVDNGKWQWYADNSGNWIARAINDAATSAGGIWTINRTGTTVNYFRIDAPLLGVGHTPTHNLDVVGDELLSDSLSLATIRDGTASDSVAVLKQLSNGKFVVHKIAQSSLSGITTVGTFDSQTSNANGLVILGNSIYGQSATASNPGMINTGTQTIAGTKTFNSSPVVPTAALGTNNGTAASTGYVDGSTSAMYKHTIFTPSTGGTVNLVNNQYNIINPSGTIATLTVNLPSSPNNNDRVYIKFTQAVTAVTYANGTVVGGITAPTAGGLTVLVFDFGTASWD